MQVGPLYEQAVELTPRAARIAAVLLAQEPALPAPLRRSLAIALGACGGNGACASDMAAQPPSDRDAQAAQRFVEACRRACAPH